MEEFVRIALSFPPAIFSLMLILVVIYWIFMVLGVLDLDFLDFDVDLDLDLDVDLDVDVDVDLSAGIDGAAEGAHGLLASALSALSIGRVPITISFSFFTLSAWAMSFASINYLEETLANPPGTLLKIGVFAATTIAALIIAGIAVRPLRGLFDTHTRRGQDTLIGKLVRVSTGRVDSKFGQATLEDGGAGLILSIRSDDADNNLQRGQQALIVSYDESSNIYYVEPYDNFLNQSSTSDTRFDFDDSNVLLPQNLETAQNPTEATTSAQNTLGETP